MSNMGNIAQYAPLGWFIYKGEFYLLRDLKWYIAEEYSDEEFAAFYYKTKEEAEATLLKWEATVP